MKKWLLKFFKMTPVWVILVLFFIPGHNFALEEKENYVIGKILKLKSRLLEEEREIYVRLPEGYENSKEKYPVLYILDARRGFPIGAAMLRFFAELGQNLIFCSTGKNLPDVIVDPRVELLSIVFRLAGNPEYNRGGIPSYNEDVEQHFANFKEHPVIKTAQLLRMTRGVGYNAPMSLAVHITGPDAWKERVPFDPHPQYLDKRWSFMTMTNQFLKAARDFARETQFKTFFAQHQEFYKTTIAGMKKVLQEHGHLDWFDKFFGHRPGARFTVIPGLLNGGCCYGASINPTADSQEIYSIIGIWKVDKQGIPLFDETIIPLVVHEFCHSYVNPLVDKHEKQLERAGKKIFSYVEKDMTRQAYGEWKIMMYESVVRACVVRYILTNNGPTAAQKQILEEKQNHFSWIGELADFLGEYEANRGKYPDLDSFFPRIETFFNDYAAKEHFNK